MCGSTVSYFIEKFGEDHAFGGTVRLVVGHSNVCASYFLDFGFVIG